MNNLKTFLCVLACTCMLACSSDSENNSVEETPTESTPKYLPMSIEVDEDPLHDPTTQSASRRAPITFLSTLNAFRLNYVYYDEYDNSYMSNSSDWEASQQSGKWKVGDSGQYGWPPYASDNTGGENGNIPLTWYAYANSNDNSKLNGLGENNPYVNFTVEEASTAQKDFLVSKKTDTWNNCQGKMFFLFSHACSALRFNIKKSTNVSAKSITVSEVKLKNVNNTGRFYMNDFEWKRKAGKATYTLYSENSGQPIELSDSTYKTIYAGTLDTDNENAYLFMIPQELTAWNPASEPPANSSGAYLEISLTIDGTSHTGYVPFSGTFVQGNKHEVNINLGKNSLYNSNGGKIINE